MKRRRTGLLRAALDSTAFRLEATQDLARVGDWELDRHSGRMRWSRQLFRLFDRPEALGVPDINEALAYYNPTSLERTRDAFWQAIDTGRRCALEQEVTLPSGQVRHHVTVIVPVSDGQGQVYKLYGTVQDITERKQMEAERIEHLARLETLSRHLVAIEERERRELASTLHDRASPNLAALRILFANLFQALPPAVRAEVEPMLDDAGALLADTTAGIREICTNLRPATLDYGGLAPALNEYVTQFRQRTGLDAAIDIASDADTCALTPASTALCFRLVQEALTNCAKHAQAGGVRIHLERDAHHIRLTVADDGVGFDLSRLGEAGSTPGLGLITMRERVELAGGRFCLHTRPGEGTEITVDLPCLPSPSEPQEPPR
ncbi:ATP-binding protein [Thauera sp.]|jgi:signal transduction histidine kinase|uniref:PAS domain-containing sensor histidine kinase n=1 Tax=Thauera sp. TaxID=1905334 RepID=UPI002A3651CC|nr:ATP-binding protein [Thauera sp.]MDX9885418.1 ATP-binding protein [Thauera sp.]